TALARHFPHEECSMPTHTQETHAREPRQKSAALEVPDGFPRETVKNLSSVLNALLADVFAIYLKTKNFHSHMSGQHFRDYPLLLDEQASPVFDTSNDIAEQLRQIGGSAIHSI